MGCGRVGATLARSLESQGHDVAVVDTNSAAFRRLGNSFEGKRVTGLGFDRDTLLEAGIEQAYAFAAVSNGDNSNILAARVARETYGVEHVVARIYDPGRAEIYQRLGIPTVGTVRWTADQMLRRLLPQGSVPEHTDPSGHVVIADVAINPAWVGRRISELEDAGVQIPPGVAGVGPMIDLLLRPFPPVGAAWRMAGSAAPPACSCRRRRR